MKRGRGKVRHEAILRVAVEHAREGVIGVTTERIDSTQTVLHRVDGTRSKVAVRRRGHVETGCRGGVESRLGSVDTSGPARRGAEVDAKEGAAVGDDVTLCKRELCCIGGGQRGNVLPGGQGGSRVMTDVGRSSDVDGERSAWTDFWKVPWRGSSSSRSSSSGGASAIGG